MHKQLLLLATVLLLGSAAAVRNGPVEYEDTLSLATGFDSSSLTIMSGAFDMNSLGQDASIVVVGSEGFSIEGLSRVCWAADGSSCASGPGPFTIVVDDGGAFAVTFGGGADVHLQAGHALGMFTDVSGLIEQAAPEVDFLPTQTFLGTLVNGTVTLGNIDEIETTDSFEDLALMQLADKGLLKGLSPTTQITVVGPNGAEGNIGGDDPILGFEGTPRVTQFGADAILVPFGDGATATILPATPADARIGIEVSRLTDALATLGVSEGIEEDPFADLGVFRGIVKGLLNGAMVEFPTNATSASDLTLLRVDELQLEAQSGSVRASGTAALAIKDGEVEGAKPLVKLHERFVLPWWGIMLWIVGIALFITTIVTGARKEDRFKGWNWIGRIVGIGAFALVIFLWDKEVNAVFGFSAFNGGGVSTADSVVLGLEIVLLVTVILSVVWPLSLVLGSVARLAGYGKAMGLVGPAALLLGFWMGAPLLLSYIEFLVSQAP